MNGNVNYGKCNGLGIWLKDGCNSTEKFTYAKVCSGFREVNVGQVGIVIHLLLVIR